MVSFVFSDHQLAAILLCCGLSRVSIFAL